MRRRSTTLLAITTLSLAFLPASPCRAELKTVGSEVEISGRIADIRQTTESSGYSFRVHLSGIHYSGRVDRTLLEKKDARKLTVWLALRDVVLTIDRTTISGRPGSATCGPVRIQMGHRRDLWVAFDFETDGEAATAGEIQAIQSDAEDQPDDQDDEERQPSLRLTGTRFGLPADNWSVGDPAWVRTSGFGMSRSKVVRGLRGGLTSNRQRIESRLIEVAPKMLAVAASLPEGIPADRESVEHAMQHKLMTAGFLVEHEETATADANVGME